MKKAGKDKAVQFDNPNRRTYERGTPMPSITFKKEITP